ncbi:endonuclease/exonuclease/phosphatase family protein [Acidomonas methanolica]|uniref:endonuclease/exonuclease/phosphatase family protein n=1 Tax=Acidomonas methanolica TaxID=437 RepID=UPI00211A6129|nr:endonuclease/exonuclease/phosphatase family protein [Acidomonas methanolica]
MLHDTVLHPASAPKIGQSFHILSWNLLRRTGAPLHEVLELAHRIKPDIFLMQEATAEIDRLPEVLPGHYARFPLPGRIHGTACWSRFPFTHPPTPHTLPSGLIVQRTAQIIDFGTFSVANVHLSHGQVLNRRQLRAVAGLLRRRGLIMGDFNLVGPPLLPGFHDVGPRMPTHRMADLVPIRIDRCLTRGMTSLDATVLPNQSSDHHPIAVTLRITNTLRAPSWRERFALAVREKAAGDRAVRDRAERA